MAKILVIEDEIAICENVVEILELEGFETLAAHDGEAGIDLALKHLPDLILCDIMMPVKDGYQVLFTLRDNALTAMIPFVFLTAKADRPSVRLGMQLGADDYLPKPFAANDLVAAVTARIEKQRIINQRYAKALDDLRGNVFHMLPHELRTPLVSILGYAELLIWDAPTLSPERVSNMAEHIRIAGERLHHLIENFLIYAQIEILRIEPDRQTALRAQYMNHPHELTAQIAARKAKLANREADLQIAVTEVPRIPIALENLQKVIEELIDNAFKFSDPGTPVQVTTDIIGHEYQWTIRDYGRGMTPEQIANIGAGMQFERRMFEQQGAGLGLVISQRLVELHTGRLAIESDPGQQTTVRVVLPLN